MSYEPITDSQITEVAMRLHATRGAEFSKALRDRLGRLLIFEGHDSDPTLAPLLESMLGGRLRPARTTPPLPRKRDDDDLIESLLEGEGGWEWGQTDGSEPIEEEDKDEGYADEWTLEEAEGEWSSAGKSAGGKNRWVRDVGGKKDYRYQEKQPGKARVKKAPPKEGDAAGDEAKPKAEKKPKAGKEAKPSIDDLKAKFAAVLSGEDPSDAESLAKSLMGLTKPQIKALKGKLEAKVGGNKAALAKSLADAAVAQARKSLDKERPAAEPAWDTSLTPQVEPRTQEEPTLKPKRERKPKKEKEAAPQQDDGEIDLAAGDDAPEPEVEPTEDHEDTDHKGIEKALKAGGDLDEMDSDSLKDLAGQMGLPTDTAGIGKRLGELDFRAPKGEDGKPRNWTKDEAFRALIRDHLRRHAPASPVRGAAAQKQLDKGQSPLRAGADPEADEKAVSDGLKWGKIKGTPIGVNARLSAAKGHTREQFLARFSPDALSSDKDKKTVGDFYDAFVAGEKARKASGVAKLAASSMPAKNPFPEDSTRSRAFTKLQKAMEGGHGSDPLDAAKIVLASLSDEGRELFMKGVGVAVADGQSRTRTLAGIIDAARKGVVKPTPAVDDGEEVDLEKATTELPDVDGEAPAEVGTSDHYAAWAGSQKVKNQQALQLAYRKQFGVAPLSKQGVSKKSGNETGGAAPVKAEPAKATAIDPREAHATLSDPKASAEAKEAALSRVQGVHLPRLAMDLGVETKGKTTEQLRAAVREKTAAKGEPAKPETPAKAEKTPKEHAASLKALGDRVRSDKPPTLDEVDSAVETAFTGLDTTGAKLLTKEFGIVKTPASVAKAKNAVGDWLKDRVERSERAANFATDGKSREEAAKPAAAVKTPISGGVQEKAAAVKSFIDEVGAPSGIGGTSDMRDRGRDALEKLELPSMNKTDLHTLAKQLGVSLKPGDSKQKAINEIERLVYGAIENRAGAIS